MNELHGMIKVDFTDHEFAKFMRDKDPNWIWEHVAEYTRFLAHGRTVALIKYKNDYPVARYIWIQKDCLKGHHTVVDHPIDEKFYCEQDIFPFSSTPVSNIYEDSVGPYWLKESLKKEGLL